MVNKKKAFLIIIILMMMCIPVVSGETITGELTESIDSVTSTNIARFGDGSDSLIAFTSLSTNKIESLQGTFSWIHFDDLVGTTYSSTKSYAQASVVGSVGATQIFTGTIGYQRNYNILGVEIQGYQYIVDIIWDDVNGLSGGQTITLVFDNDIVTGLGLISVKGRAIQDAPDGSLGIGVDGYDGQYGYTGYMGSGNYNTMHNFYFSNDYSFSYPSGLGISGSITKGAYISRGYVFNASTGATIITEATPSLTTFNFAVSAQPIKVGALSGSGHILNSSVFYPPAAAPTPTPTPIPTTPPHSTVQLDVKDAITKAFIADTTVGIKNTTSGVWRNSTLPTGAGYADSTGAAYEYPLSIGQSITLAANKTGYSSESSTFYIPYSGYLTTLYLTPSSYQTSGGNWNLVVSVKRNLDLAPIYPATVRLQTGVGTYYDSSQTVDESGTTTFTNVTASTSAIVSVVSQMYQDTSVVVTVFPNQTQHVNIEMILKGGTPVTTKVTPRPTSTPYDPNAPSAYPTPTDASGQPITDSGLKGFAAFNLLIDALYAIMGIVVGIIFIWLMWMTVYMITGGKIIDKIMRRGRR